MKVRNGYIDGGIIVLMWTLFFIALLVGLFFLAIFSNWEVSEDNVSGIVYNTTNNGFVAGNTDFSVRAAVDTYVSEENQSSYCLPKGSPYIELVNRAARDKNVKVQVTTKKGFWVKMPWTCIDNVVVEEVK